MLRPFIVFLALNAFGLETGPFPGKMAPDFSLPSLDGTSINLKEYYDKGPVWLTLFTTWCPGCAEETPLLAQASKNHPDVQFLAVSLMEDKIDVQDYRRQFQVPYPIALDSEGAVTDSYQIRPIPVNLGIQKGGKILFRRQLIEAADLPALLGALESAGQVPEPLQAPGPNGMPKNLFANLPLLASFLAGVLTFLSPCVLPLIPAYIAFVSGFGLDQLIEARDQSRARRSLLISTAVFILGFGSVFTILGASASALGQALAGAQDWIRWGGGVMMVLFGLHLAGVLNLMPLYKEKRFQYKNEKAGLLGAYLMGVVFAAGWTPCVGPVLSAILVYSASEATVSKGAGLLMAYSAGIGLPFLLASSFISQFQGFIAKIKPYFATIEIASGALLIILGFLLITNKFAFLAGLLPTV